MTDQPRSQLQAKLLWIFAQDGEAMIPLARALIGGMAVSTLLTLFLVPCVYTLVKPKQTSEVPSN